jgi:nucleotide-binding universal stress UspA family protein
MFKTVLTYVGSSSDDAAVMDAAVAFAKAQDAELIGLAGHEPFVPTSEYISAEAMQMIADQEEAGLQVARTLFDEATIGLGNRAHWRIVRERPNLSLTRAAAGADVIVTGVARKDHYCPIDCSSLVMEAGLPVLVTPPGVTKVGLGNIVVAWRNTAEARRAISVSLPLLKRAEKVTLVEVAARDDVVVARDVVHAVLRRLAAHGVRAQADVDVSHDAVGMLLEKARGSGAELVVLGAYGHSRTREWVLGGVTADLMACSPLPMFFVH